MRRLLRWSVRALAALALLLVIFSAFVYASSSSLLRRTVAIDAHPVSFASDSAMIAEGGRLARVRGCYGACHGKSAGGQPLDEAFVVGGAIPDLTRLVREYTDAELERVIRHGVKPNGRRVVGFMPSAMFNRLSDQDLAAIVAFLRAQPPASGPAGGLRFRYLARVMLALHLEGFATDEIDQDLPHGDVERSNPVAFGEYVARTSCAECHGTDLTGAKNGNPPDLRIIGAYSLEQFTRLMRTGIPLDGRRLGLMAQVARGRFVNLTEAEVAALHAYGRARAQAPAQN